MSFKPMLAATVTDLSVLKYPIIASPKLDGIRGVIIDGKLHSRSLKPIPNPFVTGRFSLPEYSGLDGELILGEPTASDVYRSTNSACARETGTPDVNFYVFDDFSRPALKYVDRWLMPAALGETRPNIIIHEQRRVHNEKQLLQYEHDTLEKGYEGLILRSPYEPYKFGRSTLKSQGMVKLKRFTDSEAEILAVYEEMENTNEKKTNELGRGARSSHKSGLVGKGRAGGFDVRDVNTGVSFSIGTGLNDVDRDYFWKHRKNVVGKVIKYKSFLIGVKDAPRHPVYLGPREKWDL